MQVLVTGANGFIGKNLLVRLKELRINYCTFVRSDSLSSLERKILNSDIIIHLAGVNRSKDDEDFKRGNVDITKHIAAFLCSNKLVIPIVYASSIQAISDSVYGVSKKLAEDSLEHLSKLNGNSIYCYRLPNVFGKWAKPNYNSVVATFAHNVARGLPIVINDENTRLNVAYIDDVLDEIIKVVYSKSHRKGFSIPVLETTYSLTLRELADYLEGFKNSRHTGVVDKVGKGLIRALYATFLSYFKPQDFSYELRSNSDSRGTFVEMLKTKDSGQFSFFTAHQGVTRGGHYHHTKNEKFLVIKGSAKFKFRHIITDEIFEINASCKKPKVIETIPGWSHDVTNVGEDELIVMLWANEIFDRHLPDTIMHKV